MFNMDNLYNQKDLIETVAKYQKENKFYYWNKVVEEMNTKTGLTDDKECWRSRYRFMTDEFKKELSKNKHNYIHNKDKEQRILSYLKTDRTIDFLIDMLEMEEIELLGNIELLRNKGYEIQNNNGSYKITKKPLTINREYKIFGEQTDTISFCAVSDTHLGNKNQQITYLNSVYDECAKRGIKTVLHSGDISDGTSHRPEHKYELFALGADEQAEYIINNYPKHDGITTYFITGNHDSWHFKNGGIDIGKMISNKREDMIYLGNQSAVVNINNCKIKLFHPLDGSAYAYSYSSQKTIDAIRGGDKPNILLVGHHHKQMYMIYRNIHTFEVPSFLAPTQFIEGKRLSNDIGAWFITAKIDNKGQVLSCSNEAITFYNTLQNDYNYNNKVYKKELKIK